jgi:SAM-dependent methyltransferase
MNQAGDTPLIHMPRRWDVIASFMLDQGYKSFVEVGCKEGRTTGHILKNVPDSLVYAIDPWQRMPQQKSVTGGETYEAWDFDKIEAEFWRNVDREKVPQNESGVHVAERLLMYRMASADAVKDFPAASFDLVFIDAAHDYENVKLDIQRWWPKVRDGGMLVGHDFNHKWPGVERAVADSFDLLTVGCAPDSLWFVIKAPQMSLKEAA